MITHDQILPSLYQLQRTGRIGEIAVCASTAAPCARWRKRRNCVRAFPGQTFRGYPEAATSAARSRNSTARLIARLPPRQIVVVAVPDQLHYDVIMTALRARSACLRREAAGAARTPGAVRSNAKRYARGLVVGIEYHKRFDDRSLMARRRYREGLLRRVPAGHGLPAGEVVLPPLELPELDDHGELRRVHLHRLPLRRPGALHHRPAAGVGERLRHRRQVSRTARKASCGPTRASSGTTAPA